MNILTKTLALAIAALTLQAQAAPYQSIVPAKSSVTFSYKQMGVAIDGRFKKFAAQVNFDPVKADAAKAMLASVKGDDTAALLASLWLNLAK